MPAHTCLHTHACTHMPAHTPRTSTCTCTPLYPPPHKGMNSRIGNHIEFPDYTGSELAEIGKVMCRELEYQFAPGAIEAFEVYLTKRKTMPFFANARTVHLKYECGCHRGCHVVATNWSAQRLTLSHTACHKQPSARRCAMRSTWLAWPLQSGSSMRRYRRIPTAWSPRKNSKPSPPPIFQHRSTLTQAWACDRSVLANPAHCRKC